MSKKSAYRWFELQPKLVVKVTDDVQLEIEHAEAIRFFVKRSPEFTSDLEGLESALYIMEEVDRVKVGWAGLRRSDWERLCKVLRKPACGYPQADAVQISTGKVIGSAPLAYELVPLIRSVLDATDEDPKEDDRVSAPNGKTEQSEAASQ